PCLSPRRLCFLYDLSTLHSTPVFFFFNATSSPQIFTLSLHDALPISAAGASDRAGAGHVEALPREARARGSGGVAVRGRRGAVPDRKSTRLNSSHVKISYAVFCLKKKKQGKMLQCGRIH